MAMAKDKDTGCYLWATEMWHKKLLDYDTKPGIVARLLSRDEVKSRKNTYSKCIISGNEKK